VVAGVTAGVAVVLLPLGFLPVGLLPSSLVRSPSIVLRGVLPLLRLKTVRRILRKAGVPRARHVAVGPRSVGAFGADRWRCALGAGALVDAREATFSVGLEATVETVSNLDISVREHGVGAVGAGASHLDVNPAVTVGHHVERPDSARDGRFAVGRLTLELLELGECGLVQFGVRLDAVCECVDLLGGFTDLDRSQAVVAPLGVVSGGEVGVVDTVRPAASTLLELCLHILLAPGGDSRPEGAADLLVGVRLGCVGRVERERGHLAAGSDCFSGGCGWRPGGEPRRQQRDDHREEDCGGGQEKISCPPLHRTGHDSP